MNSLQYSLSKRTGPTPAYTAITAKYTGYKQLQQYGEIGFVKPYVWFLPCLSEWSLEWEINIVSYFSKWLHLRMQILNYL